MTEFDYRFRRSVLSRVLVRRGSLTHPSTWPSLAELFRPDVPHFIVCEPQLVAPFAEPLVRSLRALHLSAEVVPISATGESAKTSIVLSSLLAELADRGVRYTSVVVGLGGGAVCNVVGLTASLLFRGITLVQVPTTLLGQLDAAIDYKQGINWSGTKNLVGSLYAPRLVIVDSQTLESCTESSIRDGIAEALKHGLAQRNSLVGIAVEAAHAPTARNLDALLEAMIPLKLDTLRMTGDRGEAIKQFGHAFAHALERASAFELTHGRAVAVGLYLSAALADRSGISKAKVAATYRQTLTSCGLPVAVPNLAAEEILNALVYDRYWQPNGLKIPLPFLPGRLARSRADGGFFHRIDEDGLLRLLEDHADN